MLLALICEHTLESPLFNTQILGESSCWMVCVSLAEIFEELSGRGEDPDLLSVLTVLASTVIPGLPPGGGLQSK